MPEWTDEEIRALEQDEDQWDWEHGELVEPSPPERRGATTTVRFSLAEFQRIGAAARRVNVSLIAYIHDAALDHAPQEPDEPQPANTLGSSVGVQR